MTDAPERIWVDDTLAPEVLSGFWTEPPSACPNAIEYIRADLPAAVTVKPLAYAITDKHSGDVKIIDAAKYDPTKPDFWLSEAAMASVTIDPLYPAPVVGNTDPMTIAKYDDELRKAQAGWRDFHDWWSTDGHAIDPEPDVSWYDKRRDFAEMAFNAARYQAPGEQPDAVQEARDAVIHEADFLLDRLKQYEADGCQCSRSVREWCGHVSPPMARLEAALRALSGQDTTGEDA